jgi:predicted NACHT family NTPase
VIDSVTLLVREVGYFEAKNYISQDAEVLAEAAEEVLANREAEAKAAAEAAAAAEAEAAAAAAEEEAAAALATSAPAPVTAAPAAAQGAFASVLDALKRSPLMLDLPATHPGLATIAQLVRTLCAV